MVVVAGVVLVVVGAVVVVVVGGALDVVDIDDTVVGAAVTFD